MCAKKVLINFMFDCLNWHWHSQAFLPKFPLAIPFSVNSFALPTANDTLHVRSSDLGLAISKQWQNWVESSFLRMCNPVVQICSYTSQRVQNKLVV